jgi:hypothetical protein
LEDFIFYEGQPPAEYQRHFTNSLFNEQKHLHLQSESGWHSYFIANKKHKQVLAGIHFHIEDSIARSPLKNPFGSIDMTNDVPNITLFRFLEFVTARLKEIGVKKIIIKNPPAIYQQDQASLLQTFLLNLGYGIGEAEVSAVIDVSEKVFDNFLDAWEIRKLRQAQEAGLTFKLLPLEKVKEIYKFILDCRQERGYSLSMKADDLQRTVDQFPHRDLLFVVLHHDELAAASIAIVVKEDILYNFYSAHQQEYNHLSPVVMLIKGMYGYCQQNDFRLLDLGTSALDGKPNFSLLDFKLRLGARPHAKLTFEKNL